MHLVDSAGLTNQVEAAGVMVAKDIEEPFGNLRVACSSPAPRGPVEASSTRRHYIYVVHLLVICMLSYFEMTLWLIPVTAFRLLLLEQN